MEPKKRDFEIEIKSPIVTEFSWLAPPELRTIGCGAWISI